MRIKAVDVRITQKSYRSRTASVVLFEDFSNLCLANAVEPMRAANRLSGRDLYRWRFAAFAPGLITSSSGLSVQVVHALGDGAAGDRLFVMPSYGHQSHAGPSAKRGLRAARRRYDLIVGLDTGSWLLAAAGLLEGRRATIHWDELSAFAEAFPDIDVVEDRFVFDGDVATCGGATTTLELQFDLIERDHGATLALEVAALFMHGERAPRLDPAERHSDDRVVRAAAALMRRRIEAPLSIQKIADQLGVSRRGLEVRFRSAARRSPAALYQSIRLTEARRLVERTTLSVAEIAARCGYQDASAMTRAFRAAHGTTPSALRGR